MPNIFGLIGSKKRGLAIAWTPYQFGIDNPFSHCGAEFFRLVKLHDKWQVQYRIDTASQAALLLITGPWCGISCSLSGY